MYINIYYLLVSPELAREKQKLPSKAIIKFSLQSSWLFPNLKNLHKSVDSNWSEWVCR